MVKRKGNFYNRYPNTRSRYTAMAANAAAIAIQNAFRNSRARTATATTTSRKYQTSGIGVTNEHDRQRVYRKRSMPYRKKRRWKSFTRKIQYISEKELGTRTIVFNRQFTNSNSTAGQHLLSTLAIYGQTSTYNHLNDLKNISNVENNANPTLTDGISVDDTTKIFFQSAIFDLTIRNSTQMNTGTTGVPIWVAANDANIEVDIYEIVSPRLFQSENDLYDCFSLAQGDTKDLADPAAIGTGLQVQNRGCTPWDVPHALSYFRLKILKKTKYRISYGNTITYQMRDPRRHVTSIGRIKDQTGCNRPGWTKFLFIITKVVPGLTQGPDNGNYRPQLDFGVTRKYMYKLEGANMSRDLYVAQT